MVHHNSLNTMQVSVIIPAFNSEAFIGDAIKSALAQSVPIVEIIVVDDGSSDRTSDVASSFGKKIVLTRQTNQGVASARNNGILRSKGEYVAFLDSDDCWTENHLDLLLAALSSNPAAALAYSGKTWVDKNGEAVSGYTHQTTFPSGWIFSALMENNYISSASCAIAKREILVLRGGFKTNAKLGVGEDYELWLRIAAEYQVVSSAKPTVKYRRHESNLTLDRVKYAIGHLEAVRCGAKLIGEGKVGFENNPRGINLNKKMQGAYQEAIISTFWYSDYRATRSLFLQALSEKVLNFKIAVRGIISFLPGALINSMKAFLKRLPKNE